MLLWGVFTVGYLLGVMVTLKFVSGGKGEIVSAASKSKLVITKRQLTAKIFSSLSGQWEHEGVFKVLTQVNYRNSKS